MLAVAALAGLLAVLENVRLVELARVFADYVVAFHLVTLALT